MVDLNIWEPLYVDSEVQKLIIVTVHIIVIFVLFTVEQSSMTGIREKEM